MAQIKLKELYSAPRRFDLSTIFVVTLAFSIFCALLRLSGATTYVFVGLTLLLAAISVSQLAMFGGERPRLASIITGATANCGWVLYWLYQRFGSPVASDFVYLVPGMILVALWGSLLGYVFGISVAGVFLMADVLRQFLSQESGEPPRPSDGD